MYVRSHESYLSFVVKQLNELYKNKTFLKNFYFEPIVWCSLLALSDTFELLKHRYSSNPRGRKPHNPCDMLRSLMRMHYQHVTSVVQWVFVLKTTPILAVLSGLSPDTVPGVGTFYDFFNRLWLGSTPHLSNRKKRKLKKPRKKGKKNQKEEPNNTKSRKASYACLEK